MPLISVVMPVFNAGPFLRESVASILGQTHREIQFLIIDDGSTDPETRSHLKAAACDKRVQLIARETRNGISSALNIGIDRAAGEFIARMDADDISHPQRLERQLEFMFRNPAVGVCGTAMECFGPGIQRLRITHPQNPEEVKCRLLLSCPISHPTVMFRRRFLEQFRLRYNEKFPVAQDYELWTRCSSHFPMANLKECLLQYRVHPGQNQREETRHAFIKAVIAAQWDALCMRYSESELSAFYDSLYSSDPDSAVILQSRIACIESIFLRILEANNLQGTYDSGTLKRTLSRFWMTNLPGERCYSWKTWGRYRKNAYTSPAFSELSIFLLKCMMGWESRDPRRLLA